METYLCDILNRDDSTDDEIWEYFNHPEFVAFYDYMHRFHEKYVNGSSLCPRAESWNEALYIFYSPLTGLYKIGVTRGDIHERRIAVENNSGLYLFIAYVHYPEPDIDESVEIMETLLHDFFKSKRMPGEWFSLSIRDVEAVITHLDTNQHWHENNFDDVVKMQRDSLFLESFYNERRKTKKPKKLQFQF